MPELHVTPQPLQFDGSQAFVQLPPQHRPVPLAFWQEAPGSESGDEQSLAAGQVVPYGGGTHC